MKKYAILTECLNCGDKKIWNMEAEAANLQDAGNQAVGHIDNSIMQDDYPLCCPSSPIMILSVKETSEEYTDAQYLLDSLLFGFPEDTGGFNADRDFFNRDDE